MDNEPAENLLLIAKRHLSGNEDEATEPNPPHAFNLMRAIIGLYPQSRAAGEARHILQSNGVPE